MINRLVLAYGPPKCGKHAAGKVLLDKHRWGHVSLKRSLLKADELYLGFNISEMLKTSDTVDDDITIPAFMLRIAECARIDAEKNVFFEGVFGRLSQVSPMIEHASRFARQVEVVEFQLPDDTVWKRIGSSGDNRYRDLKFGQANVAEFRQNLPKIKKIAEARLARLNGKGSYYSVDAGDAPAVIARRIVGLGKKVA